MIERLSLVDSQMKLHFHLLQSISQVLVLVHSSSTTIICEDLKKEQDSDSLLQQQLQVLLYQFKVVVMYRSQELLLVIIVSLSVQQILYTTLLQCDKLKFFQLQDTVLKQEQICSHLKIDQSTLLQFRISVNSGLL